MKSSLAADSKQLCMNIDSFVQTFRETVESREYATSPETQAEIFHEYLSWMREELRRKLDEKTEGKPLPPGYALDLLSRASSPISEKIEETRLLYALVTSYLVEDRVQHGEIHAAVRLAAVMGGVVEQALIDIPAQRSKFFPAQIQELIADAAGKDRSEQAKAASDKRTENYARKREVMKKRQQYLQLPGLDEKKILETLRSEFKFNTVRAVINFLNGPHSQRPK